MICGLLMLAMGSVVARAVEPLPVDTTQQIVDFQFIDRDGVATNLTEVATDCNADYLLLFDPDCDECHALINQLIDAEAIVIAIFPVDLPLEEGDPNLEAYRRACTELPASWIVGIDNGAILADDLYLWEHLPLLMPLK